MPRSGKASRTSSSFWNDKPSLGVPEGLPRTDSDWTLTATEALARQLREQANLERSRAGHPVWEAPRIASLSRWCIDHWSGNWPTEQLLSATQELILWRQAIERDGQQLLAPLAAAREARRTDLILRRYKIDDVGPLWTDEHRAFGRWRRWVQSELDRNGWITGGDVPRAVCRQLRQGQAAVPSRLLLAGFTGVMVPCEHDVLEALKGRGTHIEVDLAGSSEGDVQCTQYSDTDAQFRAVAIAVRDALAANIEAPPSILIALPAVEERRLALESTLREFVAPWVSDGVDAAPWRWLQGQLLEDQPWVALLLDILWLRPDANDPARLSRVLLSQILFDEAERAQTARVDEWLRERGVPRIRLAAVSEQMQGRAKDRIDALLHAMSRRPSRALPSAWAAHFLECLQAIGWPGSRELDSQAYQAVRAGRELLDRLASLDAQLGQVPSMTARQWLQELARGPFSPRADHVQPVRIASLVEAASLSADLLFVLDADSAHVPAPVRPMSFVPPDALREAGVPEASPEAWLARSQAIVASLLKHCAADVRICRARVDERGAESMPCALFTDESGWGEASVLENGNAVERALGEQGPLTVLPEEDPVPAVNETERSSLRPGVALFDAWFEAPFFAFCRERLGIHELALPRTGIPSQVQGQVLHQVLHDFFARVTDHAQLSALDARQIEDQINPLLERAVLAQLPIADYGASLVALERGRMRAVLLEWLAHERRRVDGFEVIARESLARPNIAGLQLSLRIDRVDRVSTPHGERILVMDYKTGRNADPKGWKAERAAQLPLYASFAAREVAGVDQVNGVCFAHLKEGHPALSACTDWRKRLLEEPAQDLTDNWQEHLSQWHMHIDQAARGFLAGVASRPERQNLYSFNAALFQLINELVDEDVS